MKERTKQNPPLKLASNARPRLRFITAASLFDGHDAAINIMRRILIANGAEVIHLGHNRSVDEILMAALQEDADAIAVSSYQGGHVEFFKYLIDLLKKNHSQHIKVFGGGGGTITPQEIQELQTYGVTRLFSPEDGRRLGLEGIIHEMLNACRCHPLSNIQWRPLEKTPLETQALAQALTVLEQTFDPESVKGFEKEISNFQKFARPTLSKNVVIGLTGTGGAGKSSLTDELVLRVLNFDKNAKIAVLAVDPTRKKTGGALLGDRLRMNSITNAHCFMRSLATREANAALSKATQSAIHLFKQEGFSWIFVETGGIGQADTSIVELVDVNLYVMTSEFGAPTQLEKINMLDYADCVVLNKFDKTGALDALLEVKKALRRNHREFENISLDHYPVFGTVASRFNDPGVTSLFEHLMAIVSDPKKRQPTKRKVEIPPLTCIVPKEQSNYLGLIAHEIRSYRQEVDKSIGLMKTVDSADALLAHPTLSSDARKELEYLRKNALSQIPPAFTQALSEFEIHSIEYKNEALEFQVRDSVRSVPLTQESLSHNRIRKVVPPHSKSRPELLKYTLLENLPGYFPFTAGVFPLKRTEEDPKRQFAGEGPPARTNKRFHLLSKNEKAKRLSTAFDSVTLYGEDPSTRPDIYGKIGESGVSICTLDDMKVLYQGFDLCAPSTSVSMTINGPAPILLAFYFNTAIDQQVDRFVEHHKRAPHTEELIKIQTDTLKMVRGTVQADILKEDQAQNTCIFSTEFALKMMGDIQEFFIQNDIRNYYSVSISGYHIAEAGANPISQLAFTLANGFTYIEYYRARGMNVDDFAPNFSFFFSNGLDPEYTVIGRVARRIWSIAMKNRYKANERSQKLKYHVQTSGRSLHAQEMAFNDIRTTLQALLAYFDSCNSLHTNAYDEALTTPTEESVRRAQAIQLILTKEFGWAKNENPLQGSYFIEELTDLVEEAVLKEFDRLTARGGVLGAMEAQYQRSVIQEESLYYEKLKHNGQLPIVGVNTFENPNPSANMETIPLHLTRATYEEKTGQIERLETFHKRNATLAPQALENLKNTARSDKNTFQELMNCSRVCSLGQITRALYEIGGKYRRGM